MKIKNKILALALAVCVCMGNVVPAYAEDMYGETGQAGVNTASIAFNVETFTIRLPKTIASSASTAHYSVDVKGSLAEGCSLIVQPENAITLYSSSGAIATATVTQNKIIWEASEIAAEYGQNSASGTINSNIPFGSYAGSLNFNVEIKIPGLYGTDGVFTSWEELLSSGMITVSGTTIMSCNTGISGDLVLPSGTGALNSNAFKNCTGLTSIYFPTTLETIYEGVCSGCADLVIEYNGVRYTHSDAEQLKALIPSEYTWWRA